MNEFELKELLTSRSLALYHPNAQCIEKDFKDCTVIFLQNDSKHFVLKRLDTLEIAENMKRIIWAYHLGIVNDTLIDVAVDGNEYIVFGGKYYFLLPYLEGNVYNRIPFGNATFSASVVSTALATFHRAVANISLHPSVPTFEWTSDMLTAPQHPLRQVMGSELCRFAIGCSSCNVEMLPRRIIHGDLHSGNLIFSPIEGARLIDFEKTRWDIRMLDLCYLACDQLMYAPLPTLDVEFLDKWWKFCHEMIHNYDELCPLMTVEKDFFPYGIVYTLLCHAEKFLARQDTSNVELLRLLADYILNSVRDI